MLQPMSYKEFQNLACTSARQYYEYLTERFDRGNVASGTKVINIHSFHPGVLPGEFFLVASEKVMFPDACQIWIRGQHIPSIQIISVNTQGRTGCSVHISDRQNIMTNAQGLVARDILIISDLRFLVKRIGEFYESQNFPLSPSLPPPLPDLPEAMTSELSQEQREAIHTALTTPISYISGAPGTGKTKAVLSKCILRYLFSKKRILLLAPTNNAVEQMLRGVLPILKASGIDLNCAYRLGTTTEEFAKEFPEVVGNTALDAQIRELMSKKEYYRSLMFEAEPYREKANLFSGRVQLCQEAFEKMKDFLPEADRLRNESIVAVREFHAAITAQNDCQTQRDICNSKVENTRAKASSLESEMAQLQAQISKMKILFWKKSKREELQRKANALQETINATHAAHLESLCEYDHAVLALSAAKENHNQCFQTMCAISSKRTNLRNALCRIASADEDLLRIVKTCGENIVEITSTTADLIQRLEITVQELTEKFNAFHYEDISSKYKEIEHRLGDLQTSGKVSQRENALLLAGTIDSALGVLSASNPYNQNEENKGYAISHVFLDEAGYTCLAKGMAAFAAGAPVTFLGDHRQLPPVCEMNSIPPELAPVCLWELPVAYYSELIYGGLSKLYQECYQNNLDPSFSALAYAELNKSYRFGMLLANVLAKYVYSKKFQGANDATFVVLPINAPSSTKPYKNSSQSEADAIANYLLHNPGEDIAILTPYRDQVKCLRNSLPKSARENILTIHRSQGREWDTVILSVVDTNRPYFMNSDLPIGRRVINTAVSRAKRRLVIVCDIHAWANHPSQLIAELLRIGQM